MRFLIALLVCLFVACAVTANADTTVVARRGSVISAQDHAVVIARRGSLVHSSCGQYEGIGTGSTPEAARRNCCFYGTRVIVEEGRWFAVIRYR
jgi:hypothetical protein